MTIRNKRYFHLFYSIALVIISGNAVRAEDITLKGLCNNRNSQCDSVSYASKIYSPTYQKDNNKATERLRDLGWQDITMIDVKETDAQAIVAKRVMDGKTYYLVSFRGTEIEQFKDVIADLNGSPKDLLYDGKVHQGFYDYTKSVYDSPELRKKLEEINADQGSGKPYEILLTGQSLGGAAAQVMSYFLVTGNGLPSNKIKTVVFGSPAPGNKAFSDKYLKDTIRVEIDDPGNSEPLFSDSDPVPYSRNVLFTNVNYGTKVKLLASLESKRKIKELVDNYKNTPGWNIKKRGEIAKEIIMFRTGTIHMEYEKEIERIYEEFRIAGILKNNSLLDMNNINSCYTSQGASHITSASCYISRAPEESLFFPNLVNSLPQTPEKKSEYTDGTIVRAPLDIGLTWNQATNLDLDSHTVTPNGEHVFFDSRGSLTQAPFVFLYRDSIPASGIKGAEQTRITQFQDAPITQSQDGTYRFYIYNYSDRQTLNSSGLSNSAAKVQIFQNGEPLTDIPNNPNTFDLSNPDLQKIGQPYPGQNTFNVPTGQSGNTWYVFKLNTRTGILNRVDRVGDINGSANVPTFR